jgi:3-oxoacid CoA-transferase A subunit
MINKIVSSMEQAVADIRSGDRVMIGGFGSSGIPFALIDALLQADATDLVLISNNAGVGDTGIGALLKARKVRKIVCSYPRSTGSVWFEKLFEAGEIELELLPQGTLSERIRAAGAGIGGFFTRAGFGTALAKGKETRIIDGHGYVLEMPLAADVALIKAECGDRWGNLTYNTAGRNFNPIMATAAKTTIAEVAQIVELGELDPEAVVTPGIFVDRLIRRKDIST